MYTEYTVHLIVIGQMYTNFAKLAQLNNWSDHGTDVGLTDIGNGDIKILQIEEIQIVHIFIALHHYQITCYIALYVTLHYMLYCITCYIALHVTLHYMLHCITCYTALNVTLHYKLH